MDDIRDRTVNERENEMRTMTKGNLRLDVVEHIILRNMWEYYVLADEPDTHAPDPDIVYALVMGDHDEIGTVSGSGACVSGSSART
jgi:hypothetical protein